jgi:CRISPR-associated protein Cmr6
MIRPLYKELAGEQMRYDGGNAGLWYDKYCNQWGLDLAKSGLKKWSLVSFTDTEKNMINPKDEWIGELSGKAVGTKEILHEHNLRYFSLIATHGQSPLVFTVEQGRFVTGLGREHPVENGFTWHHTLGVPYLPGSSIKGMVRAWGTQWLDLKPEDTAERIFGDSKDTGIGSVIFMDALPIEPVKLEADVMTPHYGPYYQDNQNKEPPADWHNPVPIPFLTVAAGTRFLFGILPRNIRDNQAIEDCQTVKCWLEDALAIIGAGAKTAVGYGRFRRDDQCLGKLQEDATRQANEARVAARSREEQEIENLRELFQAQQVRNERDAGSKTAQELLRILNLAGAWKKNEKIQLAELSDEIVSFLRYGKQKLKERKKQIAELRNASEAGSEP